MTTNPAAFILLSTKLPPFLLKTPPPVTLVRAKIGEFISILFLPPLLTVLHHYLSLYLFSLFFVGKPVFCAEWMRPAACFLFIFF